MSMNLTCKEVNLRQTPTAVIASAAPYIHSSWATVLGIYLTWYISGVDYDDKDARWVCEDHVRELIDAVRKHKKLTFGII